MVFSCFNCHSTENLHRAPSSLEMREKWLELFPEGDMSVFNDSFRICSEHFDNKYIMPTGVLSARAIPTKFLVHNVWCEIEDEIEEQAENVPEYITDSFIDDKYYETNQYDTEPTAPDYLWESLADEMPACLLENLKSTGSMINPFQFMINPNIVSPAYGPLESKIPMNINEPFMISKQVVARRTKGAAGTQTAPALHNFGPGGSVDDQSQNSEMYYKTQSILVTPLSSAAPSSTNHPLLPTLNSIATQPTATISNTVHKSPVMATASGTVCTSPRERPSKATSESPVVQSLRDPDLQHSPEKRLDQVKVSISPDSPVLNASSSAVEHTPTAVATKSPASAASNSGSGNSKQRLSKGDSQKRSSTSHKSLAKESKNRTRKRRAEEISMLVTEQQSSDIRKKVCVVMLKRLKFPGCDLPPPGKRMSIKSLAQLNNFSLDRSKDRDRERKHRRMSHHNRNGVLNSNSQMDPVAVVDLTLDDDSLDSNPSTCARRRPEQSPPVIKAIENNGFGVAKSETRIDSEMMIVEKKDKVKQPKELVRNRLKKELPIRNELKLAKAHENNLNREFQVLSDRCRKLKNFLDELSASGLVMKRDDMKELD